MEQLFPGYPLLKSMKKIMSIICCTKAILCYPADQTKNAFRDAAKQWESQTCINFTENPSAADRVKVSELPGCYSCVGKCGSEQVLSLGNRCAKGFIAAHEIGHLGSYIPTRVMTVTILSKLIGKKFR
ncbi:astacin [Ostertagia ostertagi]